MELMFLPLKRYVDFQGRSRRSEFWLWVLFRFLVSMLINALMLMVAGQPAMVSLVTVASWIFYIAIFLPSLAVNVRRFHDINRTGWWVVFPTVVMIIAGIVFFSVHGAQFITDIEAFSTIKEDMPPDQAMALMSKLVGPIMWILLPTLAASLLTFIFNVLDGTPGPNRFGPDPKGRGGNSNVF